MHFASIDATLHPSPRAAMRGAAERRAYVVLTATSRERADAIAVIDTAVDSSRRLAQVGETTMDAPGDGLRHLAWSVGSASLAPGLAAPATGRRFLVAPGTRSSRVAVLDVGASPDAPDVAGVISARDICGRAGYSRPTVARPGPGGVFVSAMTSSHGSGPGGLFLVDARTFDVRGRWELDRGPQHLSSDFGWHLGYATLVTGGWGPPALVDGGLDPAALDAGGYGHHLHAWALDGRRHVQALDLGATCQMVTAVRPAHDPTRAYGFALSACARDDLSSSVWLWYRATGDVPGGLACERVIRLPAVPAAAGDLPAVLRPFGLLPPLATSLALSLDDRYLYIGCWGAGLVLQYDVSDPFNPVRTGEVRLGGLVARHPHPSRPRRPLSGGPHTITGSHDGRRLYVTNGFEMAWHRQLYGDDLEGWLAQVNVGDCGGMTLARDGLRTWADHLACDVRLEGGDAASDAYCYA